MYISCTTNCVSEVINDIKAVHLNKEIVQLFKVDGAIIDKTPKLVFSTPNSADLVIV